jgi:hypothetical protein
LGNLLDRDFLRLTTFPQSTRTQGARTNFRKYLQELDDEELSSEARNHVFLCETSLGGSWRIDLFKTNLIKEEFERRGELELFEVAEKFIFEFFEAFIMILDLELFSEGGTLLL